MRGVSGIKGKIRSKSFAGLLAALACTALALWAVDGLGGPGALYGRYGAWAAMLLLPLHVAVCVTPVGEFVPWGVANGLLFGFGGGALLNWTAWMGAAVLQYGIGASARREMALDDLRDRLPGWLAHRRIDHPVFLTCVRWFPMGGSVFNTAAGALGICPRRLFAYAALGYAPQALVIAAAGAGLVHFFW